MGVKSFIHVWGARLTPAGNGKGFFYEASDVWRQRPQAGMPVPLELRDRYLEQFNAGMVLPAGKYAVGRLIEAPVAAKRQGGVAVAALRLRSG